jgi:hypothetical protein
MSYGPLRLPSSALIYKDLHLRGFLMDRWIKSHSAADVEKVFAEIYPLLKQKNFKLWLETFNFNNFEAALTQHLEPMRDRKVVLKFE